MAGTDGGVRMKHYEELNPGNKGTRPQHLNFKETSAHKAFVLLQAKLAHSVKQEMLLSRPGR